MLRLVKNDRLDEVYLNQIRKLKLMEHGMITKSVYLDLDEMKDLEITTHEEQISLLKVKIQRFIEASGVVERFD